MNWQSLASARKPKRARAKTPAQLRKTLWGLISRYVRLSAADEYGIAQCVTCPARKPWQQMQAGHFVPQARGNATRYDLRNIHCQCFHCNINLGSNPSAYAVYMLDKYGEKSIRELESLAHGTVKFSTNDYRDMIADIELRLKRLETGDTPRTWQEDNVS